MLHGLVIRARGYVTYAAAYHGGTHDARRQNQRRHICRSEVHCDVVRHQDAKRDDRPYSAGGNGATRHGAGHRAGKGPTSNGAIQFDTAPGLAFTKPLAASIKDKALHKPRWSDILLAMIAQVKAKGFEGEKLVRELAIPAKVEQFEEEGFRYHPELGISVQGQSATDCWKEVDRLAKKWRIPVSVEFWWRQTPKAQYPGKTGLVRSGNI